MTFHNTMHMRIPESGILHLMYTLYATNNMSVKLDIRRLLTNCNQYLLDRVDKSSTSGKVSCIPISILKKITKTERDPEWTDEKYKAVLLSEAEDHNPSLYNSYSIYYKPVFTKPVVTKIGWEQNPILNNVLEAVPDISRERGDRSDRSNRNLWLSNINLAALMKSYIMLKPKTLFLGVTFLSCFDGFDENDMNNIYKRTALYHELEKKIKDEEWDCYLAFIVSYSHWSSIIIDKKHKKCYHFCSGGNDPSHFKSSKKMIFYSSSKSFIRASGIKTHKHSASKNAIFQQLISHEYTIYLNVESCQIVSGECGMFASMFLILYCIQEELNIKALYNSFAFLGDKTMGMYKDLLFWRKQTQSNATQSINLTDDWKNVIEEQLNINCKLTTDVMLESLALKELINP